jgi:hypothetical protein
MDFGQNSNFPTGRHFQIQATRFCKIPTGIPNFSTGISVEETKKTLQKGKNRKFWHDFAISCVNYRSKCIIFISTQNIHIIDTHKCMYVEDTNEIQYKPST